MNWVLSISMIDTIMQNNMSQESKFFTLLFNQQGFFSISFCWHALLDNLFGLDRCLFFILHRLNRIAGSCILFA